MTPPTPRRTRAGLALLSLALGAGAVAGLTVTGAGSASAERTDPTCTPAERADLRAAGDNFDDACALPGQALAGLDSYEATADQGEVDKSSNVRQIARKPLVGSFTPENGGVGSDLAFQGKYAYDGNYNGFAVFDISRPTEPKRVAQVECPGGQGDVSVYRDVLVLSVDSSRSDDSCSSVSQSAEEESSWEGLRVFDISDPAAPEYVASVETDCGSHTHTLAPSKSGQRLFVYVSSYGPNDAFPDCQTPHDRISIVTVPVADPAGAELLRTPRLFPGGGNPGSGVPGGNSATSGCHDITAYPKKDLAAGACMGDGILMDISKRAEPRVIDRVRDERNFAFWHSATFNNAGTKVVFTDELGGGGAPTCNPGTGPKRGANGIYDIVRRDLEFRSYYKIPRTQALTENCVAHNGSLIPVEGRDIMVQAWYQGGFSVFDFTNSRKPVEIAHFDRGAISDTELVLGGSWSTYWYNGHIYSSDITRGLEVFAIDDPRVNKAKKVRMGTFNAQSQPSYNG
ncbi:MULTISPECIES: LVIVD repeat-containing protein [unclassified Nocardioides]|uniref:LVIVD repeat-containing protein n=1 Tax=unclassified Nocardioides TaxID=2615069 RepID=UPI000702AE19|nr:MULTISPECIES: hypothetical protein [unclassified Nocardioides]KQP64353.1 hypothetical protein ASF47_10215 [Nocardioides sp. Leaf285]